MVSTATLLELVALRKINGGGKGFEKHRSYDSPQVFYSAGSHSHTKGTSLQRLWTQLQISTTANFLLPLKFSLYPTFLHGRTQVESLPINYFHFLHIKPYTSQGPTSDWSNNFKIETKHMNGEMSCHLPLGWLKTILQTLKKTSSSLLDIDPF
jgi:hypothetical protein